MEKKHDLTDVNIEELEELAREAKNEYMREYKERPGHREKINQYQRDWRKNNPDKVAEYNRNYWLNKALESKKRGVVNE